MSPISSKPAAPEIAVVIPVYNEAENIEAVLKEWIAVLGTISRRFIVIALNDGSKDQTGEVLQRIAAAYPHLLQIIEKPNSGHGRTCRVGYEAAVKAGAQWVLQIDSDGQCDPQYFLEFWKSRAGSDCVFGKRKTRDDGFARILTSACCRIALLLWTGTYHRDPNVPYRLMRCDSLKVALSRVPQDFNLQNIALSLILRRTPQVRWNFVPIHFRARRGGENSINLKAVVRLGWEMLQGLRRLV